MNALDSMIEQLVFGVTTPKPAASLGVYLSPETIYIAQTKVAGGRLAVEHLVRIPIPPAEGKAAPSGTMTMSTDFLADPAKIGGLVRQSMSQIRWATKDAVVTLSHHLGLLRYFPMPPIEKKFLKSAVPLEAKKYIPIPMDALAYDYMAAAMPPDAAGKPRQGILMGVTQKRNLENVTGLLQALGLKLVGLEVAPCSVLRVWQSVEPPKGPEPFAQVHFDGGSVRVMICDRGMPVFFREVFLGADATLADQRKIDLPGCLGFAQKQLGLAGVSRIRLSGTPANLGQWKDAFSQETSLPAEIQDTAKLLSIKGGDWGGYASIGASARTWTPLVKTIDLAAADRVSDDELRTARDIVVAGAAAAGLVSLLGLYANMSYSFRARELNAYAVDPAVKAALEGLDANAIELKLKDMRDQAAMLQALSGGERHKLSDLLREVVDIMPETIWVVKAAVSNPLIIEKDKPGLEITIQGRARGSSGADEQDQVLQFQDALRRHEKLGKLFEVQISLSGKSDVPTGEAASGLDPKMLSRKLEERTEFTLLLKARR